MHRHSLPAPTSRHLYQRTLDKGRPAGEATRNASHVTDCSISLQIRELGRATSAGEAAVQKLSDGVVHDLPDLALRRRLAQTKQALQPHRATQHVQEVIR